MPPSAGCGHGPREHPLVKLSLLLSATAATHPFARVPESLRRNSFVIRGIFT